MRARAARRVAGRGSEGSGTCHVRKREAARAKAARAAAPAYSERRGGEGQVAESVTGVKKNKHNNVQVLRMATLLYVGV